MECLVLKNKSGKSHFTNLAQVEEIELGSRNTKEYVYFIFASFGKQPQMFNVEDIESITTTVEPIAVFLSELHDDLDVYFNKR